MKVAYLTGEYPRATDTFIQREIAVLRQQGIEVTTFSVRRTGDEHLVGPEQREERSRTTYLLPPHPAKLLLAHLTGLMHSPSQYLSGLLLAWKTAPPGLRHQLYQLFYFLEAGLLAWEIRRREISHLHNHFGSSSCTVAMLAAEIGGFGYSFTLHGPHVFFNPEHWHLREKIKRAKFVSCISHFCRSQAMYFAPWETWDRLHIVHCGVDPEKFEPVEHRPDQQRLLYTGRLAPEKGLPILLESLVKVRQQHPGVVLTVVGDGPARSPLESLVHQLGLQNCVEFVGYQSQGEVRRWLNQTAVFVLPSFAEGVPVSLMEAMAAGVPVVTTQIAGVSELVEDGVSGFLVPPGDGESLGDRLSQLLTDAALRQQMGTAGREKVEVEFSGEVEARKLGEIFKKCV